MKTYLGDAVYAEETAGMIRLTTEDGLDETNVIYLEPEVAMRLKIHIEEYLKDLKENQCPTTTKTN